MSLGWHLTFRLKDSRVIAPETAARRRVARSFLEIGERFGLLAFRVVLDHAHGEFLCDREQAGQAAQAIGASITLALGLPAGFNVTYLTPIRDQRHLDATFAYILGNDRKHGTTADPLHDASVVPDLVGLRALGTGVRDRVAAHLPGRLEEAREALGVASLAPRFSPGHLADAAAAAVGLATLKGRSEAAVLARAAAVQVAGERLRTEVLAGLLGCDPSTVRKLRDRPVDRELVTAVALGMGLRLALGERATRGSREMVAREGAATGWA
jgi:hypothetical protein